MAIKFFGQYLLEKSKITPEQLLSAVEYQKEVNVSVGTLAIEKGYLTAQQVDKINREQLRTDNKFGEIAIDFGYLTQEKFNEILAMQITRKIFLGESLVQKGYLTLAELEKELELFREEQEKDETEIKTVLNNVKSLQTAEVFVDVTIKMFLRMLRETVKIGECSSSKDKVNLMDWTFYQKIMGAENCGFLLNLSTPTLLKIASNMMKMDVAEPDEISCDAVAEFVNIITGNGCAKLSTVDVKLKSQPPIIYDNRDDNKYALQGEYVSTVDLLSTIGDLQVAIEVYEDD
ncbi:MAG: chemotaxis protein CheX [Deltaproteobacteria bacterium]|nr:chemotaxis protein CheX [Deltaproteobacteria bacterium]